MIRLFPHSLPTSAIVVAGAGVFTALCGDGEGRGRGERERGGGEEEEILRSGKGEGRGKERHGRKALSTY
jgi:hypothetical protein